MPPRFCARRGTGHSQTYCTSGRLCSHISALVQQRVQGDTQTATIGGLRGGADGSDGPGPERAGRARRRDRVRDTRVPREAGQGEEGRREAQDEPQRGGRRVLRRRLLERVLVPRRLLPGELGALLQGPAPCVPGGVQRRGHRHDGVEPHGPDGPGPDRGAASLRVDAQEGEQRGLLGGTRQGRRGRADFRILPDNDVAPDVAGFSPQFEGSQGGSGEENHQGSTCQRQEGAIGVPSVVELLIPEIATINMNYFF